MAVYAIYMLYKRKQQKKGVYLFKYGKPPQILHYCICLFGIKELLSFRSADQGEAGKWILSPLVGGMGSREQEDLMVLCELVQCPISNSKQSQKWEAGTWERKNLKRWEEQEDNEWGNVHGVALSVQHLLGQNALKLQHQFESMEIFNIVNAGRWKV